MGRLAFLAEVTKALAWPLVLAGALVAFRVEIRQLLPRLRKAFGALEIDPPTQQRQSTDPTDPLAQIELRHHDERAATPPAAAPGADERPKEVERLRSRAVLHAESVVSDAFKDLSTEGQCKSFLTMAAIGLTALTFENIEQVIWASQLRLLDDLNAAGAPGIDRAIVKRDYYDPAAVAFPPRYDGYSFDAYLAYLTSWHLIEPVPDADALRITTRGEDYLQWRVQMHKPRKTVG